MRGTKREIASGLTAKQVRERLRYDRETGKLFYRRNIYVGKPGRICCRAGDEAGCVLNNGYVEVGINNRHFLGHRLIWLIETGEWPEHEIDHKDMDRSNNRWSNLREATGPQNRANSKPRSKSGFKGVTIDKRIANPFRAQITVNNRGIYLGRYKTAQEAHDVYCLAAKEHFGDFARAE